MRPPNYRRRVTKVFPNGTALPLQSPAHSQCRDCLSVFIVREYTRAPHVMLTLRVLSTILPRNSLVLSSTGHRARAAWPPSPSSSTSARGSGMWALRGRGCGLACRRDKLAWGQDWRERHRPQRWKCHWNSLCSKARLYKLVCPSTLKGPCVCMLCITYAHHAPA